MRHLKKEIYPIKISIKIEKFDSILDWLMANIGDMRNKWNFVNHYGIVDFYFVDHNDAILFTLTWR